MGIELNPVRSTGTEARRECRRRLDSFRKGRHHGVASKMLVWRHTINQVLQEAHDMRHKP